MRAARGNQPLLLLPKLTRLSDSILGCKPVAKQRSGRYGGYFVRTLANAGLLLAFLPIMDGYC